MEKHTSVKISIPKPCHEDWNKMTPNEKGAFCGKCCKTVVDFTHKTPEEIRDTLIAQSGKKVCGRFMSDQLDEKPKEPINLNVPFYLLPKNISYRKAFAIALFFAFGTSLFSCRTTEDHIVGDIAIVNTVDTPRVNTTNIGKHTITGDTVYSNPENIILGGVSAKPECTPLKGDVAIEHTKGEVVIKDTSKTPPPDTMKIEPKMGKIKIHE